MTRPAENPTRIEGFGPLSRIKIWEDEQGRRTHDQVVVDVDGKEVINDETTYDPYTGKGTTTHFRGDGSYLYTDPEG